MRIELSLTTKNLGPLEKDLSFLGATFSSRKEFLDENILSDEYKKAIGLVGVNVYNKSPFFYLHGDYQTSEASLSEALKSSINIHIEIYFGVFRQLMSFLWLQKDNCSTIGTTYVYLPEIKTVFEHTSGSNYSMSNGEKDVTHSFTNAEIESAFIQYAKISKHLYHGNIKVAKPDEPKVDLFMDRKYTPYDLQKENRLERALNFLDFARSTSIIPQKIAFYMCIYESLFFGTDSTEITHQIAERVALYAVNVRTMRHEIYRLIKDAYKIRSTYFHGNSFGKYKLEKLIDISTRIDGLTRNILNRILREDIDKFVQPSEKLDLSFRDLLFEDERHPDGITTDEDINHLRFNE